MEVLVSNEQDMRDLAIIVLSKLGVSTATVIALDGDLGAGKTTFTKVLARELGIQEHITSPTFVIQKSYRILNNKKYNNLIHIDAYRLESGVDMETLDFGETLKNRGNLIIIEWANNIKEALPKNTLNIKFEYIDETTRKIAIDGTMSAND